MPTAELVVTAIMPDEMVVLVVGGAGGTVLDTVMKTAGEDMPEDAAGPEVAAGLSDARLCETELVAGVEVARGPVAVLETGEGRMLEIGSSGDVPTVVGVVLVLGGLDGATGVELEVTTTGGLEGELWDRLTPLGVLALKFGAVEVSTVLPDDGCTTKVLGVVTCGVLELVKAGVPLTEVHADQLCDPPCG